MRKNSTARAQQRLVDLAKKFSGQKVVRKSEIEKSWNQLAEDERDCFDSCGDFWWELNYKLTYATPATRCHVTEKVRVLMDTAFAAKCPTQRRHLNTEFMALMDGHGDITPTKGNS